VSKEELFRKHEARRRIREYSERNRVRYDTKPERVSVRHSSTNVPRNDLFRSRKSIEDSQMSAMKSGPCTGSRRISNPPALPHRPKPSDALKSLLAEYMSLTVVVNGIRRRYE
jgi:hypothetical protein